MASIKGKATSPGALAAGLAALAVSIIASIFLVLGHFQAMSIPGCGIGSPCAEAAASAWGKIPAIDWPVSFVGLAYFLAVAVGWSIGKGVVPPAFKWLTRAGAAVSLIYVLVIIVGGHWCMYCLAAHIGNFAFCWIVERRAAATKEIVSALAPTGSVFLAATLVLAVIQLQRESAIDEEAGRQIKETTDQVLATTTQSSASKKPEPAEQQNDPANETDSPLEGFTGRYHRGPDDAAIRVVAFTDYQCPVCARLEETIERMMLRRPDVRVSIKQFPACEDCNPHFKRKNLHPNACRAAYAAEAAGILGGPDAFWRTHDWLFTHGGEFSYEALAEFAKMIGLDSARLIQMMDSPRVRRRVESDIAEAVSLGIPHTPTVFINGVELRGTTRRDALLDAVATLATKDLPVKGPEADEPRLATQRYVDIWKAGSIQEIVPGGKNWPAGPMDAPLQVVMWGDMQDAESARVDAAIRRLQQSRGDIRYEFRCYPLNNACNPTVPRSDNLMACLAARTAIAAGFLDRADGYWRMHDWLIANREGMYEEGVMEAAERLGLNREKLAEAMEQNEVGLVISENAASAAKMKLKYLPWLFVNGRQVPKFYGDAEKILSGIFDEAMKPANE